MLMLAIMIDIITIGELLGILHININLIFLLYNDTARGLWWNKPERSVKELLVKQEEQNVKKQIGKYIKGAKPKIGWEGSSKLSHFDLVKLILKDKRLISVEKVLYFFNDKNLKICLKLIEQEFKGLMSSERIQLVSHTLKLRHQLFFKLLNE